MCFAIFELQKDIIMEEKVTEDNIESNQDNNLIKKDEEPSIFTKFFNNFNFLISIWFTIIIMMTFEEYLPELDWPWYLDKILIFAFFFILLFSTIDLLKPLIISGLVIGTIILTIYFIYSNEKNPGAVQDTSTDINKSSTDINIHFNPDIDSLGNEIDSIKRAALFRDSTIKFQIDSLNMELNMLKKRSFLTIADSEAVNTKSNKDKGQN